MPRVDHADETDISNQLCNVHCEIPDVPKAAFLNMTTAGLRLPLRQSILTALCGRTTPPTRTETPRGLQPPPAQSGADPLEA